jgi:hypothetical protein
VFHASNGILELHIFFTVHPVPAPASTKAEVNININEGTNNQNEILFNLAKAISLAPNINGIK